MTERNNIDTPENWSAASEGYSLHVAPRLMEPFSEEFIDRLGVHSDARVLEVGAGTGALTLDLASRVGSVLAVDFAPKMLTILGEKLKASGTTNVVLKEMDGQALDIADNAFDFAACNFALMLFPDRHKGFSEMNRVVKPGGRAMVSGWSGPDRFEMFRIFLQAMNMAFPNVPPPPTPPPVFSLADPVKFKSEMEEAGFRNVTVEHVSRVMTVPDFKSVWQMTSSGAPPVKMLFDMLGPEGPAKIRESLYTLLSEKNGDGPFTFTNTATVGYGDVP